MGAIEIVLSIAALYLGSVLFIAAPIWFVERTLGRYKHGPVRFTWEVLRGRR